MGTQEVQSKSNNKSSLIPSVNTGIHVPLNIFIHVYDLLILRDCSPSSDLFPPLGCLS